MKQIVRSKIFRKMLILSILVNGLVFVTLSNQFTQPVMARPCCQSCEPEYNECMFQASGNPPHEQQCASDRNYCQRWCITCSYGGGYCDGNYDCGPLEQCSGGGVCVPR